MWRDLWATHRRAVIIVTAVTALVIGAGLSLAIGHQTHRGGTSTPPAAVSIPSATSSSAAWPSEIVVGAPGDDATRAGLGPPVPAATVPPTAATGYDHAAWDAIPAVTASTTAAYPPIPAELRTQPNTFAAAFGTELLTRHYATASRADLLSWAQSEAAPLTITQVPLTGPDRNKALVVSLTSTDWDGAASTLVPSAADWATLASLHAWMTVTSVKVEAVTDFPPPNVTFTDPLALARLYTATVTLHTIVGDSTVTSTSSVAFQLVLGTSLHHGRVFGAAAEQHFVQRGQS